MHEPRSDPWQEPDEDLVCRMAAGDEIGLTVLYERHIGLVFSYLCGRTRDRGLAEEAAVDTFAVAWWGAGRYEARGSVRSWLLGIAHGHIHNATRRKPLPSADERDLTDVTSPESSPEEIAVHRVEIAAVATAMKRLSSIHQEVIDLVFRRQLSMVELADVLNVSVNTAKSRLRNARLALNRELGERSSSP